MEGHALDYVNTLVQSGTFLVILITAVAAVVQLRHLRASNELDALLRLSDHLRHPDMQEALRVVQLDLGARLSDAAYRGALAAIGYIDERRHPEMGVCNWFNEVGTLVKNRLIDEGTFLDIFSRLVVYYWNCLEPVVAILRRRRGAGQYENFEYLAMLARAWNERHPEGAYPRGKPRIPIGDPWLASDSRPENGR